MDGKIKPNYVKRDCSVNTPVTYVQVDQNVA